MLTATDAEVVDKGDGLYELRAGDGKAVITALPGIFNGSPVSWRTGFDGDTVYLEAVLYEGPETALTVDESVYTELALATELLHKDDAAFTESPEITRNGDEIEVNWNGLAVRYNPYSETYE